MSKSEIALALLAFGLPWCAAAQVESLGPLHAQPRPGAERGGTRSDLGEHFIYLYDPQVLPLMDDFSIDRTRHLGARPGDPGVTLTDFIYRLDTNGVSSFDMAFQSDTTRHYTVDTTQVDTIIITQVPNPSIAVTVFDLDVYPPTSFVDTVWPPYTVWDTVGSTTTDTVPLAADILQDSLMVYTVDADANTYDMNGTPQPLVLWEEDDVLVNGTYPIDPPSVGVATFDGLARTGYPYNFNAPSSYGLADRMTSVPIDLQYPASDSIYLSFFYQPQGLSGDDQVQVEDSLLLEMYAPDEDEWYLQWYAPYTALAPFKQVMLPITDDRFLKDGFRMRFSNKATLSGALDHWHVDYVRLATERAYDDTVLTDVTMLYPESSILQTYTSMPYNKFAVAPGSHMAGSVTELIKNLDDGDAFITYGVQAGRVGGPLDLDAASGANTSGNANSTFGAGHPINSSPNDFVYDVLPDSCQDFWKVKFWANATPDINRYNDTITFIQELSNQFSYDDGSAEAGYSLNVAGAKLACRFDMQGGDSLRAIRCYFDPIFEDPSDASFLVTVWTGLNPEAVQFQNFTFSSPEYRLDGVNHFVEYPLDQVIWVENTFYVGWVQTTADKLNLGFDKNRNNQDKIYYKTSTTFVNTSFAGSLMLRPVFVSDCDPFVAMPEGHASGTMAIWPNPASTSVRIAAGEGIDRVQLMDAMGREVRQWDAALVDRPLHGVSDGLYLVRAIDALGRVIAQQRLIVQR